MTRSWRIEAHLLASIGVFTLIAARGDADAPKAPLVIAPGVYAHLSNYGDGVTYVKEVRVSPMRSPGSPPPDLSPMLEAAFDWCAGNTPRPFQEVERGRLVTHGCPIAVDAGVYRIVRTAVLRPRRHAMPITVDLGSAVILHDPVRPKSVRVADVPGLACDPKHLGDYFNVVDPESFDDFRNADPEGSIEILDIGPNTDKTPGCPGANDICKYGRNAVMVRTRAPHGLSDGGMLELGDVVALTSPGTKYDGNRLLVKEVVSDRSFIVTTTFSPTERARGGTVRETATTIWCNGHRWRAGKPMVAIGGPGSARNSRMTLQGGKFVVDATLFRTAGVLVDGDKGSDGRGGNGWVSVDTTHEGNTNVRGQIVVDLGTDDPKMSMCQHVDVKVDSDSWGSSWGPSVWNRTCSTADIRVRQGHGGGVWIGVDRPNYSGPNAVTLRGTIQGTYDGPSLWIKSGVVNLADGIKIAGSNRGPYSSNPGSARGLIAILGTARRSRINVTAHGVDWTAAQASDLDCYVVLGNVAGFVQLGGEVTTGNASEGHGQETLFCSTPRNRVDLFVLDHIYTRRWGGTPLRVDVKTRKGAVRN